MVAAGLLALSFLTLALGAPTPDVLHVHDRRDAAPVGFKTSGAADPDAMVSLRIALKSDPTALQASLLDVSTPGSANYRKFLSKAEVRKLSWLPMRPNTDMARLLFPRAFAYAVPTRRPIPLRSCTPGREAHRPERGGGRCRQLVAFPE